MNRLAKTAIGIPVLLIVAIIGTPHRAPSPSHSTTMAAASAPVTSSSSSSATGIAIVIAYDQQCQKLPEAVMRMTYGTLQSDAASQADFRAATQKVLGWYREQGVASFCTTYKPVVAKALEALR